MCLGSNLETFYENNCVGNTGNSRSVLLAAGVLCLIQVGVIDIAQNE